MFDSLDQGPFRVTATEYLLHRGERPCPICGQAMQAHLEREALADVCPDHGVWFDQGQWERFTAPRPAAEARAGRAALAARPAIRRDYPWADDPDGDFLRDYRFDLGGGD